ncbi:MAG: hypothetical protein Q8L80_07410 [Gallionella sp.]|nr:hypothetical protein [Gallionella sp.]
MPRHAFTLLLIVLATSGCDRITGVAEQKIYDAEAVGYACRVSLKTPEDCMKENEAHSPSSVLMGWKSADKDITDRKLDPSMGANPVSVEQAVSASAPAATDIKPKGDESALKTAPDHSAESEKKPAKAH